MLARGEAFAVKSGVPAQAAAHAVHFAVQIGAAVRAVIEQFILAAVGFEICHADPGQPYGHASRAQFARLSGTNLEADRREQVLVEHSGDDTCWWAPAWRSCARYSGRAR